MQTIPGIKALTMVCRYPIAEVHYEIPGLPVQVSMEALSPAIPGDSKSSCIPVACFQFTLKNTGSAPVEVDLMEAQQKLRDLEAAADAARRERRDAQLKRQEVGKKLTPKERLALAGKILGAQARVDLMQAELARHHEEHEFEEMRQTAAKFDTKAGYGGLDGDPNTPG